MQQINDELKLIALLSSVPFCLVLMSQKVVTKMGKINLEIRFSQGLQH